MPTNSIARSLAPSSQPRTLLGSGAISFRKENLWTGNKALLFILERSG
jgi:hypothetical protein